MNKKAKSIRPTIKPLDLSSQVGGKRVNYMKFGSLNRAYSSKRMPIHSHSPERRITEGSKTVGKKTELSNEAETVLGKITSLEHQIQPLKREEAKYSHASRKSVKLSHFVDAAKSSSHHVGDSRKPEKERLQSASSSFSSMSYSSGDNFSENNETDEFCVSPMRKIVWGSKNLGQIRTMQALNINSVSERSPNRCFNFTQLTKVNPRFNINLNNVRQNEETTGIYIYIYIYGREGYKSE